MKIESRFVVKGRGPVVSVTWSEDLLPTTGAIVRRVRDGATVQLRGVERHAIAVASWKGVRIGLGLPDDCDFDEGEEIEIG